MWATTTILLLGLVCASQAASVLTLYGSVYYHNGQPKFVNGTADPTAAAYGSFDPAENHASNFAVLKIETNNTYTDLEQTYAAGYLEAAFTAGLIFDHYTNLVSTYSWKDSPPACLVNFWQEQDSYVRQMIATSTDNPVFWQQLGLVMAQYDGLMDGYAAYHLPEQELEAFAFFLLNADGDLFDIIPAACPHMAPNFEKMNKDEFTDFLHHSGHCSALVKVTGDYSQLLMSHSSWYTYYAMNRIFKHYNFRVSVNGGEKMSFSSYPGFLESLDDFYILGSSMVMLETTNNVFNTSLYQYVTPHSVYAWQRVRVANGLATTGQQWGALMAYNNSGTYNNQYMVIDLKVFTPGQQLQAGLLTVVEQIPGLVVYEDQTAILERGYWPSYNVPFYEQIYNLSGYPDVVNKYGLDNSYQLAPRAKIFRRDNGNVVDMPSLQYIMRYNDYQHDPYSTGSPWNAICSRGDLASSPSPDGCYDTKATEYALALKFQAQVINGPTNQGLPSFDWTQFPNTTHLGQPQLFDYQFELMDPQWE